MTHIGLYIHIPFCLSKCVYCDFCSESLQALDPSMPARYVCALEKEAQSKLTTLAQGTGPDGRRIIASVYVGGGTPTVLSAELLAAVLTMPARFCPELLSADCEVTCEANPGTVDAEKLKALLRAGVMRISLGFQSLAEGELRVLGRAHSAADAFESFHLARAVGFGEINVDLIFGVPSQDLESWKRTLRQVLMLGPEHISTYCLMLTPETPLAEMVVSGLVKMPPEELQAEMYGTAIDMLVAEGYRHYEISNFALAGHECRHNLDYWSGGEYLGLGAAAHSHIGDVRSANIGDIAEYVEVIEKERSAETFSETLTEGQTLLEKMFLGLRTDEGTELPITPIVTDLAAHGFLEAVSGDKFRLTRKGKLFADSVTEALV
jgi:oxygen-independent coproporphyrinogen-3 oxidase